MFRKIFVFVGVDAEYDIAQMDIKMTTRELDDYLDQQRSRLGCRVNISTDVLYDRCIL